MTIRLHVNIDHVATLRNARGTTYPDPVRAADVAERAGADGITCHLREDRRHITDDDVHRLRASIKTLMNLEIAANDEVVAIAVAVKPNVVTLVPERREERTTEGGLDVIAGHAIVKRSIAKLRAAGIRVSLFMAPDPAQLDAAIALGVDQIELHTGEYAHASGAAIASELERLRAAAERIAQANIAVAAGHGLTVANVAAVAALAHLEELNIGHAIIADAIFLGLEGAIHAMRGGIQRGSAS